MSKVFVTQQSLTRDNNGAWRPKFDLTPAQHFGELEYIFGSGQMGLMPEAVYDAAENRLDELDYRCEEDYLLATGDMVLACQVSYLMMMRGGCRMLRWDSKLRTYSVYEMLGE
ncbi:hypothetical protein UFOVP1082_25 [uncultured Caudovirales phage]|uniref:Uncharacterized protein n=1 Tax=uncultured Caudovirales phage TaxID=2100421 RepID=A0A6J7X940_9CAUD|nr:hypothetical protein UFOVP906_3 [uncultured Caudovirales phage]CAB4176426.1 hypothetical protein UFOVP992_29 [uncultured Caudovirales phage]CAB4183251.1 hypothetical protein UFOVP1082_25 [uncultured Caudovirales phage]CAB4197234.1 hypothetical protein UFOVP1322_10 [uncultured Caudovirales phage]CAB4212627.1 hypothetical protein UFOVP1434_32 [uncultured Caudovirales phage]